MRVFLILGICLCCLVGYGQHKTVLSVADSFANNYNQANYQGIFTVFSGEMKKALPWEKTLALFENLKGQMGKIKGKELLQQQGGFMAFKTVFERGILLIHLSVNDSLQISGLYLKPYTEQQIPVMDRNKTTMSLPFAGEWYVFWGGDSKEANYHVINKAQKNAFDFVIVDREGKSYKTDGRENDDYYAFGKEIIAPCDGEIVLAVDGVKENKVGTMNAIFPTGNTVILATINQEYLVFAHFKQYSVRVKQGDKIRKGQLLGLCGNTGNSSEPHLHFHIQNTEDWSVATGVKCYFDHLRVDGHEKRNCSPVRGERISQYGI